MASVINLVLYWLKPNQSLASSNTVAFGCNSDLWPLALWKHHGKLSFSSLLLFAFKCRDLFIVFLIFQNKSFRLLRWDFYYYSTVDFIWYRFHYLTLVFPGGKLRSLVPSGSRTTRLQQFEVNSSSEMILLQWSDLLLGWGLQPSGLLWCPSAW